MNENKNDKIDTLIIGFFAQEVIYEPQVISFINKVKNLYSSSDQITYFKINFEDLIFKGNDNRYYPKSELKRSIINKQTSKNIKSKTNTPIILLSKEFIDVEKTIYKSNTINNLAKRMLLPSKEVVKLLGEAGLSLTADSILKKEYYDIFIQLFGKRIFNLMNRNKLDNAKINFQLKKTKKEKQKKIKKIRHARSLNNKRDTVYDKIGRAGGIGKLIYIRSKG